MPTSSSPLGMQLPPSPLPTLLETLSLPSEPTTELISSPSTTADDEVETDLYPMMTPVVSWCGKESEEEGGPVGV